jgi:hypothetical protein
VVDHRHPPSREFNRNHIPAYVRCEDPKKYVCVYPFNHSLEWYLLPEFERRGMLSKHGIMVEDFEDVRVSAVAAFGLGGYEWLLAFEAGEMRRIIDCLRHLRTSRATDKAGDAVLQRRPQDHRRRCSRAAVGRTRGHAYFEALDWCRPRKWWSSLRRSRRPEAQGWPDATARFWWRPE